MVQRIFILVGACWLSGAALAGPVGDAARGAQTNTTKTYKVCDALGGESGPMASLGGALDATGDRCGAQ